ncbi:hypothetical protein J2127_001003 [Methanococcus voltae]|nr:hypothetical protein [Methanococcus voltae]
MLDVKSLGLGSSENKKIEYKAVYIVSTVSC